MDLTENFPRSPRLRLEGFAMLARTIDKARARAAGTLGEYHYDCPMDRRLFATLSTNADEFLAVVLRSPGDDGVMNWLRSRPRPAAADIDACNQAIDAWRSATPEGRERFERQRAQIAPGRPDIDNWTDLIEVEEGRLPPRLTETQDAHQRG
jgi:hypothetical protein